MKTYFFAFLWLFTLVCQTAVHTHEEPVAKEWMNHWTAAILAMENRLYEQAVDSYSKAIHQTQTEAESQEYLHLFNGRGQAYLLAGQYQEAIQDFKWTADHPDASLRDKITAQWALTRCYAHLEDIENFAKEFAIVREIDPHYPKVEVSKDYLIFHNFSQKTTQAKQQFTCAMIHMDICTSKEDITFTETGMCLVKKKCHCGCAKCEENEVIRQKPCADCGFILEPTESDDFQANTEAECKFWCNRIANTCLAVCTSRFKNPACQSLCIEVVEALRKGCHWCCGGDGFYKKCVEPFQNYLLQVPCDPMWD